MFGGVCRILLAAACIVSCLAIPRPTTPSLQPLTSEERDAALAPLPGVEFRRQHGLLAPGRMSRRKAEDRFSKKTRNYATLHAHDGKLSGQLSATRRLGAAQAVAAARAPGETAASGYENLTATNALGTQYGVEVTFESQLLLLDLDTGSSDTWAFSAWTNCSSGDSAVAVVSQGPTRCGFGPRYSGNFTHGVVADEHFYVEYGDGEAVTGPLGYMDVTVGGVRVRNQTVGLASDALWDGNGASSGVLGLAYPGITSAFYDPVSHDEAYHARSYSPIFSTMVSQGLVDSFFSIAINRPAVNASAGVISFGGVPEDIDGVDYDTVGEADIIIANVANNLDGASDYSFYTIIPDGWYFGSGTDDMKVPYIVDSGTTLIYLPTVLAQTINSMFDPPAGYSFVSGGFLTTCDAVVPRVAVIIDSKPFYLNPEDLLLGSMPDEVTGLCMTAFSDGAGGPFILGDVFLKNVLAVFDVGENVLQFASRVYY